MRPLNFIFISLIILLGACGKKNTERINLAGEWTFQIDSLDRGIVEEWHSKNLPETLILPGSMSENGKGKPVGFNTEWLGKQRNPSWFEDDNYKPYLSEDEFLFPYWLIPDKHYYGAAWYQKTVEVPYSWEGGNIELFLERCHWETQVWVDGQKAGMQNSLGTAHRYDLGKLLTPGKHKITVCVDNRVKELDVGPDSHSVSDHTQSNWNGIVGQISLIKKAAVCIDNIQVYPDVENNIARVKIEFRNSTKDKHSAKISVRAVGINSEEIRNPATIKEEFEIGSEGKELILEYPMGVDVLLWDEFNPNLYRLQVKVKTEVGTDEDQVQFGMREFKVNGTQFDINGHPVYLRGTLECAIFPKTAYPPSDVEEWKRIIKVCQAHGLNHMRFHSWCPPKAAFLAADELGFYFQVECSSWANSTSSIGDDKPIDRWLYLESERMILEYGNHPSFCLMAYGNEPKGQNQKEYLGNFVKHWKKKDNRRVYTGAAGWPVIEENDYHNLPQPRIQGWGEELQSIINSQAPRTNYDWSDKLGENDRPVVSHEIGQWCVYPNLKETEKYDGVLKAKNFELFKRSLEAHEMGQLADSFLLASGKLQALCYKADIEAALRTPGFGGFQLLDLHDFPGQGTALVGVLDPFWEEKGYISPEEFSSFCKHTVPLARFAKRIFSSDESIVAEIEIAHFGERALQDITPEWKIVDAKGKEIQQGKFESTTIPIGNGIKLGTINTSITVESAKQLTIEVEVDAYSNSWDIWVYPQVKHEADEDILVVQKLGKKALSILNTGGKVLLTLEKGSLKAEKGGDIGIGFSSIFWNTAWTGGQKPHTLGVLCNPQHPALTEFPTEYHSNWQWWDAMSHSSAIMLESFSLPVQPIVRVIDDWVTNRQLALIFEVNVGEGKLLVSGIDLLSDLENRREAQQLLYSLKKYMQSEQFNPTTDIEYKEILQLYK